MLQLLGPDPATECTAVIAVPVEPAMVYITFSLYFLVPFSIDNPISYTFLRVLGKLR